MKKYKLKVIGNDRVIISRNVPFIPYGKRKWNNGGRKKKIGFEYMPVKDYIKTLNRKGLDYSVLKISSYACKFITLTLSRDMEWSELLKAYNQFLYRFKKEFGNVEYIRGIEIQEDTLRYHVHIIFIFPSTPPSIPLEWLSDNWEYGIVHLENNVYDVWGLIEYLTKFKQGSVQEDKTLTYFPKGGKILSSSYGIPREESKIIEIDSEQFRSIQSYCRKSNKPITHRGHFYNEGKFCLDKTYIRDMNEFIENNLRG